MRLYTFSASPNPLKVRIALAELGVAYEAVEINLFKGEHRSESFASVNPHAKVPVLEEDGFVLRESAAILAYLGKTRGGGLWPKEPAGEARALQWLFFEAFHGTSFGTVWWAERVSKAMGRPASPDVVVAEAVELLERALGVVEADLKGDFILGGFSLADCALGVAISMLHETSLDDGRFPKAFDYARRVRERPSWAAAGGVRIHEFG